ncbi:MAG TPA: SDR family oxidoreductase [Actinomycetes bacterium]
MSELRDRVVLVTGAASGIGRRMALLAAERGAQVVGWDLDPAGLDRLVDDSGRAGRAATVQVVDVTDRRAVADAAATAERRHGGVDVLVNNAGVVAGADLLDLTDEQIERVMAVNALAPFWCTRAVLPGMVARSRGHIVTIASMAAAMGVPRLVDYAASKHAAYGFAESLRVELARTAPKLQTTVVLPFFVDTGMFEGARTRLPWLLPILSEERVAERVITAVERNQPRVILPPLARAAFAAQLLPPRWFDAIANALGVHASMDQFSGRSVPTTGATRT